MKKQFYYILILVALLSGIIAVNEVLNVYILSKTTRQTFNNNDSSPQIFITATSVPVITLPPTIIPTQSGSIFPSPGTSLSIDSSVNWIWENKGCGSSAPCIYNICSTTNPSNCYFCQGKYDKNLPNGEVLPKKNEDPTTTTNFTCRKIE